MRSAMWAMGRYDTSRLTPGSTVEEPQVALGGPHDVVVASITPLGGPVVPDV